MIKVYPLKKIYDERGYVAHFMRNDDIYFKQFGEIYFSACYAGQKKAWHKHTQMDLNYVCIVGNIQLVIFDEVSNKLEQIIIGENNYKLVSIPVGMWNGFRALGNKTAIVANCATVPHNPDEIIRADTLPIYFEWEY